MTVQRMSTLIQVQVRGGAREVAVEEQRGVWALHRTLDAANYSITHVPSGLGVSSLGESAARRVFDALTDRWPTWRCEVQWGAVPVPYPAMVSAIHEARGGW